MSMSKVSMALNEKSLFYMVSLYTRITKEPLP